MSVIVSNKIVLNTSATRTETLDGREYRAVPIVLMVDGVHVANAGALYYGPAVNSKKPDDWNQRPLVVNHPQKDGKYVSARTANIIEHRQVGMVLNAGYSKPKTGGEAWFDVEKTNRVDERIIPAIDAGKTLEVSAGYDLEYEEKTGEADGEKYTGVVINVHPDHVAILPDSVGACSNKKGCGCGTNMVVNELKPINNEASFSRIYDALQRALYGLPDYNGYVRDVYSDFFVYSVNGKLYKRGYTATDEAVTIAEGDPVQVQWVMEYRDMKGNFVGNSSLEPKEPTVADKNALIKAILAYNTGYEESELTGMTEVQLESTEKTLAKMKKTVVHKDPAPTPALTTPPVNEDAFKAFLVANGIQPNELHDLVLGARDIKNDLVANILKNAPGKFEEKWLKDQTLPTLKNLDLLATPSQKTEQVANQEPARPWWGGSNIASVGNSSGGGNGGPIPLSPGNPLGGPREVTTK